MDQAHDVLAITPELLARPVTISPRSGGLRTPAIVLALVAGAVWFVDLALLGIMVPKMTEVFTDFGVALPLAVVWITQLASVFDFAHAPFAYVLLILIPGVMSAALLFGACARPRALRIASIVLGALLILLAVFGFLIVPPILSIPLTEMTNQMNAAPPTTP